MRESDSLEQREDGRIILRSDYDKKMNALREAWKEMSDWAAAGPSVEGYRGWLAAKAEIERLLKEED